MSHIFKVGEIVEIHSLQHDTEWNGREAQVIGPLQVYDNVHSRSRGELESIYGYRLEAPWWPRKIVLESRFLRKRRPPQDWVKLCNLTDVPREVEHV